jgi:16S rRNA (uracil1498-N3)-methyltransferase
MRTIRLHADLPLAVGADFVLPPEAAEHATRVLRLPAGAPLVLFNGDGCDYAATIAAIDKRAVRVQVTACHPVRNESPLPLLLAQGIARGDKMDLIVQKATELGVAGIVPLLTERSEVRLDAARAARRVEHWQAVATSACEQSGRARIPRVLPIQPLGAWLGDLAHDGALRLALLPQAAGTIGELRFGTAGGVLLVGPEGGLGEADTRVLAQHGFQGLQLGPRILRTETAGLAALAALQACHGDLAQATTAGAP